MTSKAMVWVGRVVTALPVLVMLAGLVFSFVQPDKAKEGMQKLGF